MSITRHEIPFEITRDECWCRNLLWEIPGVDMSNSRSRFGKLHRFARCLQAGKLIVQVPAELRSQCLSMSAVLGRWVALIADTKHAISRQFVFVAKDRVFEVRFCKQNIGLRDSELCSDLVM